MPIPAQNQDALASTTDFGARDTAKARPHYSSFIYSVAMLGLLWCGPQASCIGVSALNLPRLCDSSDLVIVGSVGTFAKVGQEPLKVGYNIELADLEEAPVRVLNVLKGEPPA